MFQYIRDPILRIEVRGDVSAGMYAPHDEAGFALMDVDDAVRALIDFAGAVLKSFGNWRFRIWKRR